MSPKVEYEAPVFSDPRLERATLDMDRIVERDDLTTGELVFVLASWLGLALAEGSPDALTAVVLDVVERGAVREFHHDLARMCEVDLIDTRKVG